MSRTDRAKQFAPFDALKGLHEALKVKEYEHEKITKGELSEEKATELSKILINLEKDEILTIKYFKEGHNCIISGKADLDIENRIITIDKTTINLDDIIDIKKDKN